MEFFQKSDQVENNLNQMYHSASCSECGSTSFGSGKPAQFPLLFVLGASNNPWNFSFMQNICTQMTVYKQLKKQQGDLQGREQMPKACLLLVPCNSNYLGIKLGMAAWERKEAVMPDGKLAKPRLCLHSLPTCFVFSWKCWNCTELKETFGLVGVLLVCSFILISSSISPIASPVLLVDVI